MNDIEKGLRDMADRARLPWQRTALLAAADISAAHEAITFRAQIIADEGFGPFPVQTADESLSAIEKGIHEQRIKSRQADQAASEARDWIDSLVLELSIMLKCDKNAASVINSTACIISKTDQWKTGFESLDAENRELQNQVIELKKQLAECQASLPCSTNRTREHAKKMLGEVDRHLDGDEFPSHGCVEATNAVWVIDSLIADREHVQKENRELKSRLNMPDTDKMRGTE